MTTPLKTYPKMKDSGVEWLGEVPEHWEVARLGNLLRERGEVNTDGKIHEVLSVLRDRGVIPYAEKGNIGNKRSEDITRYKIVRADDIVVNCMNVIIGSVGISKYIGCLSPVYYVLTKRSNEDSPQYLNVCFQTKPFQKSLIRIGNGILAHRMRIPMELLKCELFPRPPLPEQTAIVRYLDYMDRRIRRLIRAKRKLITLLNEQKQVIIHHAVTRGLDPNVPLKDSGVEWLGMVPEHWEIRRLKTLFIETDNRSKTGSETLLSLRMHGGLIPHEKVSDRPISSTEVVGYKIVKPEQLVMNRMRAALGIFGVPKNSGIVSPDYAIFDQHENLELQFFMLLFKTKMMCTEFLISSKGLGTGSSGFMRLYTDQFGIIKVPFPPLLEQIAIVKHLDQANTTLDTTITRAQREIDLLTEYRTRLIADVVTGKVDVREVAAGLPEVDPLGGVDEVEDGLNGGDEDETGDGDGVEAEAVP